ncbi:cytochrome c nitrite reductase pentaheme subunit [Vibrio sp. 10N.286.49.C2]|uniref:cytochrome c nitrite reductase pentaheme subunit n=1 Tax=unclassified Vibrio TaxID=2614977 RepID=UPI000C852ECF|nr:MULTISPECIES: cytochrome c nitrite reductase pentaheme subunit [unclassified Vibrio]PMH37259.1 cytochrome c nitrite reductase pentaheme subunit [Vibrio sp. 10N.286.49.C2]PMH57404.1 cytochrome c nitrite reductase pentaheme subunit [Vibrio sp. 10N.286.49.B1]PMH82163.1 cytochrome c nitrite reductase pentaheme subunit [Vibrio sp. 10N.286.48.B7]
MGNVKLTITIMLQALLAFSFYGFSLNAFADDAAFPQEGAAQQRYKVELIRDKDYKCVQCHKDSKQTLAGSHGEDAMAALGKEVNCTQCHSNIGPDHRDGASTVIQYHEAQSQAGSDKTQLNSVAILKANQLCTDCHQPPELRKANWTHDVHAKNLTCSNCHSVHAEKAKALSYDHKTTIKMCVDCHKDFNELREEEGK